MIGALSALQPWHPVETLVAVTALIGLVLIARQYVARHFGAGVAYALWIVPLARLVLPPLPSSYSLMSLLGLGQTPATSWTPSEKALPLEFTATTDAPAAVMISAEAIGSAAPLPHEFIPVTQVTESTPVDLIGLLVLGLAIAWATGAVLMLGRSVLSHVSFMRTVEREANPVSPALRAIADRVARQVGLRRMPRVTTSFISSGPLVTGLLRPTVILPAWFEEDYDTVQQRAALAHELTHIRRGDLWALQVCEIVVALLWFNPLVYAARRAFRTDQEAACDSDVLKSGAATPHAYGQTLLKAVQISLPERLTAAASLPLTHALKERLVRMSKPTPSRSRRMTGAAVAGFIGIAACVSTASVTADAGEIEERDDIELELAGGTLIIDGKEVKDRQFIVVGEPFDRFDLSPEAQALIEHHSVEMEKKASELADKAKVIELRMKEMEGDKLKLLMNMEGLKDAHAIFVDGSFGKEMEFLLDKEFMTPPEDPEARKAWEAEIEARAEAMAARANEWVEQFEISMDGADATWITRIETIADEIDANADEWAEEIEVFMEAHEHELEEHADQIEMIIEKHFDANFEHDIETTHLAISDLAKECRDADLAEGEPTVMEKTIEDGKTVKVVCMKGDEDALQSKTAIKIIKMSNALSDDEKADVLSKSHHVYKYEFTLDDSKAPKAPKAPKALTPPTPPASVEAPTAPEAPSATD